MKSDISELPVETRGRLLAQIRSSLGSDRYDSLVKLMGEDNLLKAAIEQSSKAAEKWKQKTDKKAKWVSRGKDLLFWVGVVGLYSLLCMFFGGDKAGSIWCALYLGWIVVGTFMALKAESKAFLLFGGLGGAALGGIIGAGVGAIFHSIGVGVGALSGMLIGSGLVGIIVISLD